jgi:adenosylmethionine-8-amino-7-oxononanoate aminotransferase
MFHVKHDGLSWADRDKRVLWHPFTSMPEWIAGEPLVIERAQGRYLYDVQGRAYFDAVSSLWVTVHGHSHPGLMAALTAQLARLDHSTMLGLSHPPAIELAERLVAIAPPGLTRVFYSDAGSTAVEIALKMAYQYWALHGQPAKRRFLHLTDSYHGDTLGAVGVGGMPVFHRTFGPLIVAGVPLRSPAPATGESEEESRVRALSALELELTARRDEIAALVIEPLIQGAAGMLVHPVGYLAAAAELCRQHDVLLIADEVATGFGRTGTMFACEHEHVTPDLMCLAKGMTGGMLPLAATLCTDRIFQAFQRPRRELAAFFHGHTYTGNPLACAAALANLDVFAAEDTLGHVARLQQWMETEISRLQALPWVRQTRQCGVMAGIELTGLQGVFDADAFVGPAVCEAARAHHVIMRPLGDTLVWMPPLTTTRDEMAVLADATRSAVESVCASIC